MDRELWSSGRGQRGGDDVLEVDFGTRSPPLRWRSLWHRSGDCEFVQELVPVAVVLGGSVGGHWSSSGSAPVLRRLAGGFVFLPRRRREEVADLQSGDGFGAWPRPTCHKDVGSAEGEPFLLVHKAASQRGGLAGLRFMVFVVFSSGGCSGGFGDERRSMVVGTEDPRDYFVISLSFRVLCAYVWGQLGFQCFLVGAYVSCTSMFL